MASQAWREAHPMEYCYQALKDNAKRRGKDFTLTLEEFKKFCYKTKYIKRKGIYKYNYSIDREDNDEGYHVWNIRIVTVGLNSSKGVKKVEFDYFRETKFKVV